MMPSLSLVASLVIICLVFQALEHIWEHSHDIDKPVVVPVKRVIIIIALVTSIIFWFQIYYMIFYSILPLAISLFFPYLVKPSRYFWCCRDDILTRSWVDKLITTSGIYGIGAISALAHSQYSLTFLCTITCIGSVLYHRNREGQFFNFDNIFATSQFFVFGRTLYEAWHNDSSYYFAFGVGSLPIALFFLVYCGDPAEIIKGDNVIRESRKIYEDYHTLWHLASGCGPILASFYMNYTSTTFDYERELYYSYFLLTGILISMTVNIVGNSFGAVPFD